MKTDFRSSGTVKMNSCPSCNAPMVHAMGDLSANILIIDSKPDKESLAKGQTYAYPDNDWHKPYSLPYIMSNEFFKLGFDFNQMRRIFLWQHAPNKNEDCFQLHFQNILQEAKGKQAILLMGAESVETFTRYKVSDVSGLEVTSNMLSAPVIFASQSPSTVFSKGVGELRFALKNFTDALIEKGIN